MSSTSTNNSVTTQSITANPLPPIIDDDEGLVYSEDEMTMDFGEEDFDDDSAAPLSRYNDYEGEDYSEFIR